MTPDSILAQQSCFLEQAQRQYYFDQGYLLLPALIDLQTLENLRQCVATVIDSSRELECSNQKFDLEPGHSPDSPRLRRATYLDDMDEIFWNICSNSVVTDIATDLLGSDVRFRELMLNFKWADGGAEVKWHQDIAFYPHTNTATCQFLILLHDVKSEQGPLKVIPKSHHGPIYEHYDDDGRWTGAIDDSILESVGAENVVELTGPEGSVSVHHSCTIHGSARNLSALGRPVLVITYAAADALPYTAAPYPSSHYGCLVRGKAPRYAHHEALKMPLPPHWSNGYTSIFAHQEKNTNTE